MVFFFYNVLSNGFNLFCIINYLGPSRPITIFFLTRMHLLDNCNLDQRLFHPKFYDLPVFLIILQVEQKKKVKSIHFRFEIMLKIVHGPGLIRQPWANIGRTLSKIKHTAFNNNFNQK